MFHVKRVCRVKHCETFEACETFVWNNIKLLEKYVDNVNKNGILIM